MDPARFQHLADRARRQSQLPEHVKRVSGRHHHESGKPEWRKSSHSASQGNCVETADNLPGVIAVRQQGSRRTATDLLPCRLGRVHYRRA